MSNRFAWTVALVLFGALGNVARAQQDTIVTKDGKERKTKVISEDYDGVKYSLEGGTADLRWKQIDSIKYSGAEAYYKAVDAMSAGKIGDALPQLETLMADSKQRPVVRQGVLYNLGIAYQKQGQTDKTIATFETLLSEFPKSRYLTTVGMNLLAAYRDKGNPAGAAKAIEAALSVGKPSGTDPALDADLNVLRGNVALEQKKFPDAERAFNSAVSAQGAAAGTVAAAKLGLARSAQMNNQNSEAEKRFREITVADAPNVVLAAAWNGLGDMALATAIQARDRDGLRVALFSYLRGVVLYTPDRESLTEETERAIAGAAKAFEAMGQLEGNAERKKLLLGRAKERKDYLAAKYPRSRYLNPK